MSNNVPYPKNYFTPLEDLKDLPEDNIEEVVSRRAEEIMTEIEKKWKRTYNLFQNRICSTYYDYNSFRNEIIDTFADFLYEELINNNKE